MVQKYHYSNTLPKINKHYLGFYENGELVGVVTLGLGTRPLHTIKRIFPSLGSNDYLEIGRMCMTDEMPRNSESQMLSQLVKWIKKNRPDIKVLFTWADGMLGKPGYIYQATNFLYTGKTKERTDKYSESGHSRHYLENETRRQFRSAKHRYVFLVGDKRTKREMAKDLRYPVFKEYPKGDEIRYNVNDPKPIITG